MMLSKLRRWSKRTSVPAVTQESAALLLESMRAELADEDGVIRCFVCRQRVDAANLLAVMHQERGYVAVCTSVQCIAAVWETRGDER